MLCGDKKHYEELALNPRPLAQRLTALTTRPLLQANLCIWTTTRPYSDEEVFIFVQKEIEFLNNFFSAVDVTSRDHHLIDRGRWIFNQLILRSWIFIFALWKNKKSWKLNPSDFFPPMVKLKKKTSSPIFFLSQFRARTHFMMMTSLPPRLWCRRPSGETPDCLKFSTIWKRASWTVTFESPTQYINPRRLIKEESRAPKKSCKLQL